PVGDSEILLAVCRRLGDQERVGATMAERYGQRGTQAGRVPGDASGIDGGSVQKDGRPRGVHRLREGDLHLASQGDGLLTVGEGRVVEGGTGNFGGGFRAKRDRIVLAPESDPLAGSNHL